MQQVRGGRMPVPLQTQAVAADVIVTPLKRMMIIDFTWAYFIEVWRHRLQLWSAKLGFARKASF